MKKAMLMYGSHEVHELMARRVDLKEVDAADGGVMERLVAASQMDEYDVVVTEGGAPLAQAWMAKKAGKIKKLVMLAADETLINQKERLDYYTRSETAIHKAAMRSVDGVIALSDELLEIATKDLNKEAELARPFVPPSRDASLASLKPNLDGNTVLCVAENRPAFNQSGLVEAASGRDLVLVGRGTEELGGRGFVTLSTLLELYWEADLFVAPVYAAAGPIAPLEAMTAGVPAVMTRQCGHSHATADPLVCGPNADSLAETIEWYFEEADRGELSDRARNTAKLYRPEPSLDEFENAYETLITRIA